MKKSLTKILIFSLALANCKKEDEKKVEPKDEDMIESKGEAPRPIITSMQRASEVVDYPALFCKYVGRIALRTNADEEIGFFCQDGKATNEFIKYRQIAVDQEPGKYEIETLKVVHDESKGRSEYWMIWAFRVPIRPFIVKSRPLYKFVSQNFTTEDIEFKGSAVRRADDSVDSGLHLWSVDMTYDLTMKVTDTKILTNQRRTQYNLYQVQSGNEEMGFGVDHLTDVDNPNFGHSVLLNVSINDGQGYNDGKGSAIIIGYLHIETNNQGFPVMATKSILELAKKSVDNMYNGLQP